MHNLVLSRMRAGASPVFLARLTSGRPVEIVCAFRDDSPHVLWLAKTTSDPEGLSCLKREYEVLTYLAPWADRLRIPQVLDWDESGKQACLIQSGIEGDIKPVVFNVEEPEAFLEPFGQAFEWLHTFGTLVPPPEPASTAALISGLREKLAARREFCAPLRELDGLLARLAHGTETMDRPAPSVHGDYWMMNLLFSPRGLGVVDWDNFRAGFPLQDLFSFAANCVYICKGRVLTTADAYRHVFFSDSAVSRFLHRTITSLKFTPEELRLYFYCFIAVRILFEQQTPMSVWCNLLEHLGESAYPAPFFGLKDSVRT